MGNTLERRRAVVRGNPAGPFSAALARFSPRGSKNGGGGGRFGGGGPAPRRKSLVNARMASTGAREIDWVELRTRMNRKSPSNPLMKISDGARAIVGHWIEDQHKRRELSKRMQNIDKLLKKKNAQLFWLAMLGLFLMFLDEEMRWDKGDEYEHGIYNVAGKEKLFAWTDIAIPFANLVLVWRLCDMYRVLAQMKMERWHLASRWDAFVNSGLKWKLLIEIAIAMIQPPPWYVLSFKFSGDSWVRHAGLAMTIRVYYYARVFKDNSKVYQMRHKAYAAGKLSHYSLGFMVAVRTELKRRPLVIVGYSIAATVAVFSYIIYVIERQARFEGFDVTIDTFVKSFWFVVVTLTTVGYGDVTPSTSKGYYPAMLEGFVSLVLTSMLVAVVIERLQPAGEERDMFEWVQERRQKSRVKKAAKELIWAWMHYMAKMRLDAKANGTLGPGMRIPVDDFTAKYGGGPAGGRPAVAGFHGAAFPAGESKGTPAGGRLADQMGGSDSSISRKNSRSLAQELDISNMLNPTEKTSTYFLRLKPYIRLFRKQKARAAKMDMDIGMEDGNESVSVLLRKLVARQLDSKDRMANLEKSVNALMSRVGEVKGRMGGAGMGRGVAGAAAAATPTAASGASASGMAGRTPAPPPPLPAGMVRVAGNGHVGGGSS